MILPLRVFGSPGALGGGGKGLGGGWGVGVAVRGGMGF